MSITENGIKYYSVSIENIKNSNSNKEKRMLISEFIGNLINAGIEFSIRKLSDLLNVSRRLIKDILSNNEKKNKSETRGRKKFEDKYPEIVSQIKEICENDENVEKSLRDDITYIDVSAGYVLEQLKKEYGYSEDDCPSENTIRRIFKQKLDYKLSRVKKSRVYKKIPETDEIFKNVNKKKEEVKQSDDSIIAFSIDDKAAKPIGDVSGGGSSWLDREALDHDTNVDAIIKPFGMLNMKTNETSVYCTDNNSTAEFKVESIRKQLEKEIEKNPKIEKLFLFLDNGPENSSRRTLWIFSLIMLAIEFQIKIELVYYPPYHSKYNLIEHFWGTLQKHWNGLIINTITKLLGAINSTKWSGVKANSVFDEKIYEKGKKVDKKVLKILMEKHIIYENEGIEKFSLVIVP